MNDFTLSCPRCNQPMTVNSSMAGQVFACPNCQQPIQIPGAPLAMAGPAVSPTAGIEENVASALCYALGWVSGLIFLLVDKRPSVRFHAAQSIIVFGALTVFYMFVTFVFASHIFWGSFGIWSFGMLIFWMVRLLGVAAWVGLMVLAFQKSTYRIPVISQFAESLVSKVQV